MENRIIQELLSELKNDSDKEKFLATIKRNPDLKALIDVIDDPRTINYADSKDFNINEINELCNKYPNEDILVLVPSTKGITSDMIKQLNDHVYIRIGGVYDDRRLGYQKEITFISKKLPKRNAVDLYFSSVIYNKNETIQILNKIEEIESKMNNNWSDIQKLVYIDHALVTKITYDPEFEYRTDEEVRSLRGLITGQTVCAGYSVILAELLARQDINCYFVSGHGHAWNIVEIEGKFYGVDLTYENKNFRLGMLDTYTFLGQNPSKFNEAHKPANHDPNRALHSRICKLDKNYIKFIASTVIKEAEYEKISFKCQRQNNQEFVLIQIGTKKINDTLYYVYYYDNLENGKLANYPLILTSKETVSKYIDNVNFDRINIINSNDIVNKLFSIENIADSLNRGSSYIGEIISYKGMNGNINQLKKDESDMRKFPEPPKVYPRSDGTVLVIEKDGVDPLILGDMPVYKYNAYDVLYKEEKPVLRKRVIYSDTDIIYSNRDEIQNKLLSEENISNSLDNNSGYIGYLSETGEIVYNNGLMEYFNSIEGVTLENLEKTKRR